MMVIFSANSPINATRERSIDEASLPRKCDAKSCIRATRPISDRLEVISFSMAVTDGRAPSLTATLSRVRMDFSSWRTRSRVMPNISPIISSVSFRSDKPNRREMISLSRSCGILEIIVSMAEFKLSILSVFAVSFMLLGKSSLPHHRLHWLKYVFNYTIAFDKCQ